MLNIEKGNSLVSTFPIFIKFKKYVENYFNLKMKFVTSDWGGEYRFVSTFFKNCDISLLCLLLSFYYTTINCQHRHLVETGIALVSHLNVPLCFWNDLSLKQKYLGHVMCRWGCV